MPGYGPYDKNLSLGRPDKRTVEARLLRQMRVALITHMGGVDKLTPPMRMLIERAAMLQLRLAVLDRKILDGSFTDYDSKCYTALGNSLTRTLVALGVKGAPPPRRSLDDIRAEIIAARPHTEAAD